MNTINNITAWANKHNLITQNQTIIVGLSGGPDSVFLLHYLLSRKEALNLTIVAAHLDHEWRASSKQDALFCAQLCQQLNVPFETTQLSKLAYRQKATGSKEQDARNARRFFFQQIAQQYHADTIALAQHKNDQEETFFIRLLRGATVTGLASMWPKNGLYIRPLLNVSKAEILNWLHEYNKSYVIDPTNDSLDYLRNRIRHELIPTIAQIDTRYNQNLAKAIHNIQQTELFLQQLTVQIFAKVAHFDEISNQYNIEIAAFLAQEPFMQYRLLMHWLTLQQVPLPAATGFLDEIIRFLNQPTDKEHAIHPVWSLIKSKNRCFITQK